ncbi:glycosyltransferase family 2 protein [Terribacillus sp. JSM ZJ617]|uniref:glycosyltransferase family 2 protein n=1 Tax=Terribacillus sp. JSM ZJ617 TaxID=3342119 RepID=UPI0035A8A86D
MDKGDKMIAGIVVLYNPKSDMVIKNISTYLEYIDYLLVVDNSEESNAASFSQLIEKENIEYLSLGENKGIAFALNCGIKFALQKKADYLLTMDQDSYFKPEEIKKYINYIYGDFMELKKAALLSPKHTVPYLKNDEGIKEVKTVMTSGNIIDLHKISEIGLFKEDLFIDSVDHEYCYRIKNSGYRVYRNNNIALEHNLGELQERLFLGKKLAVTNHNYIRRYYITRNLLWVYRNYQSNKLKVTKFTSMYLYWTLITILIYEKDKLRKFKSVLSGYKDYRRGELGKKIWN